MLSASGFRRGVARSGDPVRSRWCHEGEGIASGKLDNRRGRRRGLGVRLRGLVVWTQRLTIVKARLQTQVVAETSWSIRLE